MYQYFSKLSVYLTILIVINIFSISQLKAQTVGTISNTQGSYDGYTLFSPIPDTVAYLVDNCGYVVNSWQTDVSPGVSAYLLEDGSLLRTGKVSNTTFTQGGVGGKVQRIDWSGNIIWDYTFSNSEHVQHHDIEYLPNGNVLILATELKTNMECVSAGRNPALLTDGELWPEFIVEVQPVGTNFGTIVWEWHAWDHLIQDFDNTKDNYQSSVNNPDLFDLNYVPGGTNADWMHANAIDYNPELDQIVLCSKPWSEIWVIDHSTTTAEAASHTGGDSGKGGDILYRWGNPMAYGVSATPTLDEPHDAHWIENGKPDEGKLMIFNNGKNRGYSSVDIIDPPVNSLGEYSLTGSNYGPSNLFWTYEESNPTDFFAIRMSGAQQLQNGNVLICNGPDGYFFEVDNNKNIVWEYINPVTNMGITEQGQPLAGANPVFRSYRYTSSYPGLIGKDLTPTSPIELNPNTSHCNLYPANNIENDIEDLNVKIYPNPTKGILNVEVSNKFIGKDMYITSLLGKIISNKKIQYNQMGFDLTDISPATYVIIIGQERYLFVKF